jgi:ABC-type branched-subunit amino acid transport system substrate-binding protein
MGAGEGRCRYQRRGSINPNGKKMELKVRFVDDKTQAPEAAAAMEKLIKMDGLKIVVSTNVLNLTPAEAAEVPFTAIDLQPAADRATQVGGIMEDNTDGQGLGGAVKAMAEKHGMTVVGVEAYPPARRTSPPSCSR